MKTLNNPRELPVNGNCNDVEAYSEWYWLYGRTWLVGLPVSTSDIGGIYWDIPRKVFTYIAGNGNRIIL